MEIILGLLGLFLLILLIWFIIKIGKLALLFVITFFLPFNFVFFDIDL